MASLRQLLPSAGGLIVFEAAARQLSFTAAARELGMTQAAVSYAVGRLEGHLGIRLFTRRHGGVQLTEAGARFFSDVSLGLSHIQKSAETLRALPAGSHVTLSASTAFASFWMVPRLQRFREELPGVDLRIQTADRDVDLVSETIPLGIRGGSETDWPDYDLLPLAAEEIYAVCGPSYAARYGIPESVEALLSHRLIHLEEPHRPAATWSDWFQSAGIDGRATPKGLQINDYVSVIQSVIAGQGIALGWAHLTDIMVENGVLLRLTGHVMRTNKAFHVAWPRQSTLSEPARRVRDWMIAQRPTGQERTARSLP